MTACGAAWVRDANEHRSSKCCSACGGVLDKVWSLTPERVYAAAAAKAERALPWGWVRPPARRIAAWRVVRGMLHCPAEACRARSLRHRDDDATPLILDNAISVDAGAGVLECMLGGRHDEAPPGRFDLTPR